MRRAVSLSSPPFGAGVFLRSPRPHFLAIAQGYRCLGRITTARTCVGIRESGPMFVPRYEERKGGHSFEGRVYETAARFRTIGPRRGEGGEG